MECVPFERYGEVLPLVEDVPFATMSFTPVLLGLMDGRVFLSTFTPKIAYISNSYGMSLLCSESFHDSHQQEIGRWLKRHLEREDRTYMEWLQASPNAEWKAFFDKEFPSISPFDPQKTPTESFAFCERINHRCNFDQLQRKGDLLVPEQLTLSPLLPEHFPLLVGSVVPLNFWKDANTWTNYGGTGFCVLAPTASEDSSKALVPVSWAFSSAVDDKRLEIGIETTPKYRGKGLARLVCDRLLVYCAEKGLEPVWCCRKSNIGSVRLAETLGFKKVEYDFGPIHYYHLPYHQGDTTRDYRRKN